MRSSPLRQPETAQHPPLPCHDNPETHHLAVFSRNYLQLILEGKKRVECRLLRTRRAPFRTVAKNHIVWLKEPGGPVRGYATIQRVRRWENLTPKTLKKIRQQYNRHIKGAPEFWADKENARYAVLIWLARVTPCSAFRVKKTDRRGWVTLPNPPPIQNPLF